MNARMQTVPRTIVGADTQVAPGTAMAPKGAPAPLVAPKSSLLDRIPVSLPTRSEALFSIAGALIGGYLWKRHRYLGAGLGLFVGKELKAVIDRKPSLDNIAQPATESLKNLMGPLAGVGAALAAQKYAPSIAKRVYGLPTAAAAVAGMVAAGAGLSAAGLR